MALDADHRSLCNIDISEPSYAELCNYLVRALHNARQQIAAGSPECESITRKERVYGADHSKTKLLPDWTLRRFAMRQSLQR